MTGWNVAPNANNRVSYHNLYYLSADNGGAGRLYDFSRGTHQSANVLTFNTATNTWNWGGQLTTSAVGGYSTGYIKYASNGVDKLYFMSTETHPRNNNNNLWAGYVSNGKTYDMLGNLIDTNLFDNVDTGGTVPDINQFTNVALADGNTLANPNANSAANNPGLHRFWTIDLALDSSQNPMGLYIAQRHRRNEPWHYQQPDRSPTFVHALGRFFVAQLPVGEDGRSPLSRNRQERTRLHWPRRSRARRSKHSLHFNSL